MTSARIPLPLAALFSPSRLLRVRPVSEGPLDSVSLFFLSLSRLYHEAWRLLLAPFTCLYARFPSSKPQAQSLLLVPFCAKSSNSLLIGTFPPKPSMKTPLFFAPLKDCSPLKVVRRSLFQSPLPETNRNYRSSTDSHPRPPAFFYSF